MTEASDEIEILAALAQRLLPQLAPWGQFGESAVMRPGRMAPDLPADFPLPEGIRTVGSHAVGSFSLTILDAPGDPLDITRFYDRELTARGWSRYQSYGQGGFLPPPEEGFLSVQYCRSRTGPALTIQASSRSSHISEARLHLETDPERVPCGREPTGPHPRGRVRPNIPLPMLVAPAGAALGPHGHGPSLGQYQSHADIQSDLALPEIVGHYTRILEEAGWRPSDGGSTGPVAWSIWSCRDEKGAPVEGFFLACQTDDHAFTFVLERDIEPGSRGEAERESREMARNMAKRAVPITLHVEIEEAPDAETPATLRELLQREIAPVYEGEPDRREAQLLVGELPAGMPLELPLPPDTRILGSVVVARWMMVHAESRTSPGDIEDLYRRAFPPPRWAIEDQERRLGGFMAGPVIPAFDGLFCPEEEGPSFTVKAWMDPEGHVELTLHVFTDPTGSPCWAGNRWAHRGRPQPALPVLSAPPDADFLGGGGHGGMDSWESRGFLFTALDLSSVARWYREQFEADGWTEVDEGGDEVVAWSGWEKVPDRALFIALRQPGANAYTLIARGTRLSRP